MPSCVNLAGPSQFRVPAEPDIADHAWHPHCTHCCRARLDTSAMLAAVKISLETEPFARDKGPDTVWAGNGKTSTTRKKCPKQCERHHARPRRSRNSPGQCERDLLWPRGWGARGVAVQGGAADGVLCCLASPARTARQREACTHTASLQPLATRFTLVYQGKAQIGCDWARSSGAVDSWVCLGAKK